MVASHPDAWITRRGGTAYGRLYLSIRESQLLPTFPESYRFSDNRREAQRQVGNALPPLVAQLLMTP